MCLIIDTNCATKFANGDQEAAPVAKWLSNVTAHLAVGGTKLSSEYARLGKFIKLLRVLDQRGQIIRLSNEAVDKRQAELEKSGTLISDDPHIVALAEIARCRLLYSNDEDLHADFSALKDPKGKIYQEPGHAHLLSSAPRCLL